MLTPVLNSYRNAYSGLSRSTWLLSVVMFINRSGTMVIPFLTLYLTRQMGYSVADAGFVFAFFGLGAFSGAYIGGKLTDKVGFYPIQIVTLIGGGIMFFVLEAMKSYWLICLVTYLLAFINEAFRPANSTAIAFYSIPENRTRSYALNRLAINSGWAFGSLVGGILAHFNYSWLFWVDGITNISAAVLIWNFLKPVNHKQDEEIQVEKQKADSPFKDRTYLIFIVLTCFFACCFFQIYSNLNPFLSLKLKFSEPLIGLLLSVNGIIITLIEMVLIYKLEGKRHEIEYISIGILLVGLAFLMLNIPGMGPFLAFCMITLVTVGEILAMPFMNSFWISRTKTSNRGQYAALYTMSWSLAQTLGPLGGSQIADRFGFNYLWFAIGGICLLVAFFMRKVK